METIVKQPTGFTQVANIVIRDPALSWKAKGIYALLYSKPNGWQFSTKRIADEARDGYEGTLSGLQELEKAGYIQRRRHGDGRVEYHIVVTPQSGKPIEDTSEPQSENPTVGKPHSGKTRLVSNTDRKQYGNRSNTVSSEHGSQDVAIIIDAFKDVNKANTQWYKNTTQRAACHRLIENYTLELTLKVVTMLRASNTRAYFPTITTPVQLEQKWSQLEAAFQRYKLEADKPKVLW